MLVLQCEFAIKRTYSKFIYIGLYKVYACCMSLLFILNCIECCLNYSKITLLNVNKSTQLAQVTLWHFVVQEDGQLMFQSDFVTTGTATPPHPTVTVSLDEWTYF